VRWGGTSALSAKASLPAWDAAKDSLPACDAGKASLPACDAGKESLTAFQSLCRTPAGAGGQWTSCP
jgi:hypothetical protein